MLYLTIKHLHMLTAVLSITGFIARGFGMMADAAWLKKRWVKILPHVNDTVLLATAIYLSLSIRQYPFTSGWLTAKLLALVAYIGLGLVALRLGHTRAVRIIAWLAAILVFAYIVGVARTHLAFWFLG